MKITWFGTTMLLFDDGIHQILFDCHVTRMAMFPCFFGKLKTDQEVADKVIRQHGLDRLKGILISHSHFDHVLDAPYFAKKCKADIYGSRSTINVAKGAGIEKEHLHIFEDRTEFVIGDYKIRVFASVHSRAHWYNNDLGQAIKQPLLQPARKRDYKEGGSFDFFVEHMGEGKTYVIRPSYNYIEGQWDQIHCEVLFLGIAGLSKDTPERKQAFFTETIEKLSPKLVIPVHWDNFFTPLYGEIKGMPGIVEHTGRSLYELANYCASQGVNCVVQLPLTSFTV